MPFFQSLLPCQSYEFVSQSARKICKFGLDPAMGSMLSPNRREFVPLSDCNSGNEVLTAQSLFCSKKINKML